MDKNYICICGRTFTNAQSFNGHKANCKIHLLQKYGNLDKYFTARRNTTEKGSVANRAAGDKRRQSLLDAWIAEKHKCEHCGKIMTEKFGSGRFCSKSCANSRSHTENTKEKISDSLKDYNNTKLNYCKNCGKQLSRNNKSGYCKQCFFKFRAISADTKNKLRDRAIERKLGGTPKKNYILYKGIYLDSSYELKVAKSLDKNKVRWERPVQFVYYENNDMLNKQHTYTPDFYLPDYDVYLDPKNDFLINNENPALGYKDVDKIKWVEEYNNICVIVLNSEQLSWSVIKDIIMNLPD